MHLSQNDTLDAESMLLRELINGSEDAMKQLFHTYHARLFYYISHFIKSEKVAEELVMDVFMKIWTSRDTLANVDHFDSFLFRIARNKSIDFLRSAAADRRLRVLLWEEIQTPSSERADSPLLLKEYEEKVREAILQLPPQCKKAYSLSREQELSHLEIARKLNISSATVNNHIVKAQRLVRNYVVKSMDLSVFISIAGLLKFFFQAQ